MEKYTPEDEKRAKLIIEYLKLNEKIQKAVKKAKKITKGKSFNPYEELREIVPSPPLANLIVMTLIMSEKGNIPDKFITQFLQPTIDIQYQFKGVSYFVPLNYDESREDFPREVILRKSKLFTIKAINEKDKTITVRIKLNRKREHIEKDLSYLLGLLKKEAKFFKINLRPLRPRWEEHERHIKVYKLRKEGKTWRNIADQVFPRDVDKNSAIRKVRHHYSEAVKMINGGWMQI